MRLPDISLEFDVNARERALQANRDRDEYDSLALTLNRARNIKSYQEIKNFLDSLEHQKLHILTKAEANHLKKLSKTKSTTLQSAIMEVCHQSPIERGAFLFLDRPNLVTACTMLISTERFICAAMNDEEKATYYKNIIDLKNNKLSNTRIFGASLLILTSIVSGGIISFLIMPQLSIPCALMAGLAIVAMMYALDEMWKHHLGQAMHRIYDHPDLPQQSTPMNHVGNSTTTHGMFKTQDKPSRQLKPADYSTMHDELKAYTTIAPVSAVPQFSTKRRGAD